MIKKTKLALLFLTTLLIGCEKDDICPEDTSTTPRLIIRFYDIEDTDDDDNDNACVVHPVVVRRSRAHVSLAPYVDIDSLSYLR